MQTKRNEQRTSPEPVSFCKTMISRGKSTTPATLKRSLRRFMLNE